MQEKRGQDSLLEQMKRDYTVPRGEEHVYHVIVELRQFDQKTGERQSVPRVQKFGEKTFDTSVRSNLTKQGYTMVVLHDPHVWCEQHAEELRAREAERAQAAAKAAAEAKAAERAALKAELLAEIKSELAAAEPAEEPDKAAETKKKA